MRHSALRWSVLAFTCLWFGMLVPVHQRGQIQLPGSKQTCHKADGHCPMKDGKEKAPPAGGGCAVCHYIATLDLPGEFVVTVPQLGFLELREFAAPADTDVSLPSLPITGRGLPAC